MQKRKEFKGMRRMAVKQELFARQELVFCLCSLRVEK
jgi:hypothetical protein